MGEQTYAPVVEDESVSNEPGTMADLGQDSIGHVPEGSDTQDRPDVDLATETSQEEEPETTEPEKEEVEAAEAPAEEEEVEEHPEVSKEDLEKDIAELKEKARLAQEKWEHWRDAARDARAAHFQGREVEPRPEEVRPGQPEVSTQEPPKEEDFEDYNEYVLALTDYRVAVKMAEYDRETQRRAIDDTYAQKRASLAEKLEIGREKYNDFDEIVHDPIVPITEAIVEILADSQYPAEIAYYLGKNIAETTKISRMPPLAAAREIGIIEAKIAADEQKTPAGETKPPVVKKKTTTAPAPIKPVKGGVALVSKDPSKMSNEEYRAWRSGKK